MLIQYFLTFLCVKLEFVKLELIQSSLENLKCPIDVILEEKSHAKHVICLCGEPADSFTELIERRNHFIET